MPNTNGGKLSHVTCLYAPGLQSSERHSFCTQRHPIANFNHSERYGRGHALMMASREAVHCGAGGSDEAARAG